MQEKNPLNWFFVAVNKKLCLKLIKCRNPYKAHTNLFRQLS